MISRGSSKIGLVRKRNEDRFYRNNRFGIVTDGMGGYTGGELASILAIDEISKRLEGLSEVTEEMLRQIVQEVNEEIYSEVETRPELKGMGTTVVMAYEQDDALLWASVGDSRLYIYRAGQLQRITKDHSMVQELFDAGEIEVKDMLHHPQRNILTRAVGVASHVKVDTGTERIQEGDRILLCSDGLSGYIEDGRIEACFQAEPDDGRLLEDLLSLVYDEGARDNVTIIIGRIGKAVAS